METIASGEPKAKQNPEERNMIKVIHVTSRIFASEILDSELPVVIELHRGTCPKCNQLNRIAKSLANEFAGAIKFAEVNLEESPELDAFFDSENLPALVMVDHAKHMGEYLGELEDEAIRRHLEKWIAAHTDPLPDNGSF